MSRTNALIALGLVAGGIMLAAHKENYKKPGFWPGVGATLLIFGISLRVYPNKPKAG